MAKIKLTNAEKTALLIVIRKELKQILSELNVKLIDFEEISKSIIDNLSYILKEGLDMDPEDNSVYEMFDS